jgi:hypothetical protein
MVLKLIITKVVNSAFFIDLNLIFKVLKVQNLFQQLDDNAIGILLNKRKEAIEDWNN